MNLSSFVAEVVQHFSTQLSPEERVRMKLQVVANDLRGEWDPVRLEQVLVNLLSNAFKYSPEGGDVIVAMDKIDQYARVSVKDYGVGIPKDQQERIFEPFFRSPTAVQAKTAGAGLGLYLSKEIIERHGGKMWFESEEGKGSAFYFTLPLT
jgi:signal transduction histidine kinase